MSGLMKENGLYTIKQVSNLTELPPSTLRFWEKEFPELLTPVRTHGGQRRYRGENINVIKRIKRLRDEGIPLEGIKKDLLNGGSEEAENPDHIDRLATRLAEAVKTEVYNFFKTERS